MAIQTLSIAINAINNASKIIKEVQNDAQKMTSNFEKNTQKTKARAQSNQGAFR
jgi:hypothetical protein